MDRRSFLASSVASVFALNEVGVAKPPEAEGQMMVRAQIRYMMEHATIPQLRMLLDDHAPDYRDAAMQEIIKRGRMEISETQSMPHWKDDLAIVQTTSAEARVRLRRILRMFAIELMRPRWKGMRMPEVAAYRDLETAPIMDYASGLNQIIGGGFDVRVIGEQRSEKNFLIPEILPAREGELFWEFAERNKEYISLWDDVNKVQVQAHPEGRILAHDGAVCGKLQSDRRGAFIFLLSDPGLALLGWDVLSVEAVIGGASFLLGEDPARGGANGVYIPYPEGLLEQHISRITIRLRIQGVPVIHTTVEDFTEQTERTIAGFTVRVNPTTKGSGNLGDACHFVPCRIFIPGATHGDAVPNYPYRYFTAYYKQKDGTLAQQFVSDFSEYESIPCGAEFHLALPHAPARLDICMADDMLVTCAEKTLTFDCTQKFR